MTDKQITELALKLVKAENEEEVISILKAAKLWQNESFWLDYGGDPMNYSIIGNQQTSADNALVEKLVNSVDAVLMKECLKRGIDPVGPDTPSSIEEAQKQFFNIYNGKLSSIDEAQRSTLANSIMLVASGDKKKPSFTIIDKGEGQTPKRIPETILSLTKSNKLKIPFVQGKFGMGGSGVLRFCSKESNLLLIISKRNHEIDSSFDKKLYGEDKSRDSWGVTIVRREDPKDGEKSSHYSYLAPQGEILSFKAKSLPLIPGPSPSLYEEPMASGTLIKLYEYDIGTGLRSLIGFDLYYRLSLLMPDLALPLKMIERRDYVAHSHDKTLSGLSVRLDEDKSNNLEPEFQIPSTGEMTIDGQRFDYSIYVFRKGKKENYAKREGVVFTINGQTHGFLPKEFFVRKAVGMSYLADSILVTIDCSKLERRKQEELFMPSRDRLADTSLKSTIEKELEDIIRNHQGLKDLQNSRRKKMIEDKLQDSKPLADVLENIIKKSPTLTDLLLKGKRIRNPFNTKEVSTIKEFKGKEFPTYFKPLKEFTKTNPKLFNNGQQLKIQFETDAENNYFDRDKDPGEKSLELDGVTVSDSNIILWNGIATLKLNLPGNYDIGDMLHLRTIVSDINQLDPFENDIYIKIVTKGKKNITNNNPGTRRKPPGEKSGKDRQKETYLDMPNIVEIRRENWEEEDYKEFNFNHYSALKVRLSGEEKGYDFFINMDNSYLLSEMKVDRKTDPSILEARYRYGMILLGIAMLDYEEHNTKNKENNTDTHDLTVLDNISNFTEAISPTLLPMISALGDIEPSD